MANGLTHFDIYPRENVKLAGQILENGGTLVSEYIVGVKSKKYYFPIRNRIVSGLSNKILVVEANEKSGTLITVGHGLDQGKDVFAVPRKTHRLYFKRHKFINKRRSRSIYKIRRFILKLNDYIIMVCFM